MDLVPQIMLQSEFMETYYPMLKEDAGDDPDKLAELEKQLKHVQAQAEKSEDEDPQVAVVIPVDYMTEKTEAEKTMAALDVLTEKVDNIIAILTKDEAEADEAEVADTDGDGDKPADEEPAEEPAEDKPEDAEEETGDAPADDAPAEDEPEAEEGAEADDEAEKSNNEPWPDDMAANYNQSTTEPK